MGGLWSSPQKEEPFMKQIITIGREFGAGGGELGRRLARELGIAYYDRDIILRTAKASAHLTPEQVRRWDERVPHEFGFTQSLFNFSARLPTRKAVLSLAAMRTTSYANSTTACACLCMPTVTGACCTCAS